MGKKRSRRRNQGTPAVAPPTLPLGPSVAVPNPGGRPSKYTPEVVARICALLRRGMPRERAARRAGIGARTFHDWMRDFAQFSQDVCDAEDIWVEKAMGRVTDMVESSNERVALAAAKFGLAYRFRDDFAKRVEQTGPDGAPVQHEHSGTVETKVVIPWEKLGEMSPEQLEAFMRSMVVPE